MEKLLDMARKSADQAEVYSAEHITDAATFQNAELHDIDTNFLSGIALRIKKEGKLGFAYTRNLLDRKELLENALRSLDGGVEAGYDLPDPGVSRELDTCHPSVKDVSGAQLVGEAKRVCDILKSRTTGEITAASFTGRTALRIINSKGVDQGCRMSFAGTFGDVIFPGSGSGIGRFHQGKRLEAMSDVLLDEITELFSKSEKVVEPKGGRMKVLFMPGSMITLLWRITSGLSGRSIYERISPVADKKDQRIFSSKLTMIDDPLDDHYPGARSFDDEGVACSPLTLVEKGELRSFFYDLKYAAKLGASSTGHGYRGGPRNGDPVTVRPGPALTHLFIRPGTASLTGLISMMDRGIIVEGALGAHSGNIPNGDYSIGVSPGLYVEKGEIVGRVKDAMVAGNIYETLMNVAELGDRLSPSFGGAWVPPILCDGVSVTTKG